MIGGPAGWVIGGSTGVVIGGSTGVVIGGSTGWVIGVGTGVVSGIRQAVGCNYLVSRGNASLVPASCSVARVGRAALVLVDQPTKSLTTQDRTDGRRRTRSSRRLKTERAVRPGVVVMVDDS